MLEDGGNLGGVSHANTYGGFLKWGYPQIIHLNGMFHYKSSILGTLIYGNLRMLCCV